MPSQRTCKDVILRSFSRFDEKYKCGDLRGSTWTKHEKYNNSTRTHQNTGTRNDRDKRTYMNTQNCAIPNRHKAEVA